MDTLDIFYNQVIREAAFGRVDCYFMFNMLFNTRIVSTNTEIEASYLNSNLLVPTLRINNKEEFDKLLIEYVDIASDFYSKFLSSIPDENLRKKAVLTLLWSNATIEDFSDPVNFLRQRISFFENGNLFKDDISFYSETLNSDVLISVNKSLIESETPYYFSIKLKQGEEEFYLPNVYFGISDNKAYVYAVQNDRKKVNDGKYAKKMKRLLYKVDDGLDVLNDNFENYDMGNLKDVSSGFVLASNIVCGIFKKMGIEDVVIPSILIARWNAKEISNDVKREMQREDLVVSDDEHERIQSNLTEKFLRTFRRIAHHHSGVDIVSYPFDVDSYMQLKLSDENVCNNAILEDTFYGVSNSVNYSIKK